MVKYTFLSADRLGCTPAFRDAAIKVLRMLEENKFTKISGDDVESGNLEKWCKFGFNMNVWHEEHGCKTVGCIGGWIEHFLGADRSDHLSNSGRAWQVWEDLFYPRNMTASYNTIGTVRAAKALRSVLETGEVKW